MILNVIVERIGKIYAKLRFSRDIQQSLCKAKRSTPRNDILQTDTLPNWLYIFLLHHNQLTSKQSSFGFPLPSILVLFSSFCPIVSRIRVR